MCNVSSNAIFDVTALPSRGAINCGSLSYFYCRRVSSDLIANLFATGVVSMSVKVMALVTSD